MDARSQLFAQRSLPSIGSTELSMVKIGQTPIKPDLVRIFMKSKLSKTKTFVKSDYQDIHSHSFPWQVR